MDNGRVWAATAAGTGAGWSAWGLWWPNWPDGVMVIMLALTFGVAYFLALCAFDDGTR